MRLGVALTVTCPACGRVEVRKGRCPWCVRCCRRKGHCGGRSAPLVVPRSDPTPYARRG